MFNYGPWWTLWVIGLVSLGVMYYWNLPAYSREQYEGQYAQTDPKIQQWFKNQKSPKTGAICCNDADGEAVQEDIRDGHYWVKSGKTEMFARFNQLKDGSNDGWMLVPDEVIIKEPNLYGRPVAWYLFENGTLKIRCFAPGSLL